MNTLGKIALPLGLFLGCICGDDAIAQSVGTPAVAGYNSVSACGTGVSPCFVQYGSILPVAGTITATFSTASISVSMVPQTGAAFGVAPSASSTQSETKHVFCTVSCNLYSVEATIGTTAGFILVYNLTAAPADGAITASTLIHCWQAPANSSVVRDFRNMPEFYSVGVAVAFSTNASCLTQTLGSALYFAGDVK